jgi:hypothetical protein
MAEKKLNIWNKLGLGAMAMGQGMTKQPFLSNYMEQQLEQQKAQQAMAQFQQEQQLAMLKQGYVSSNRPISTVPPGMYTEMGGQGYRFTPQIAQQQMMSQIAPYMAMMGKGDLVLEGMTGKTPRFASLSAEKAKAQVGVEAQKQKDIEVQNVKREIYSKDLTTFFAVDDVLQQARGQGLGRLTAGGKMTWAGIKQDTPLGQAVASHEAARKRLRVQLVRAAGDVGNINIVEQKAAEMMIPTQWDAADTATLKRAYLQQIGQAINSNNGNAVKDVIGRFMGTPVWRSNLVTIKHQGKTYTIPKDEVEQFKKDKGIK